MSLPHRTTEVNHSDDGESSEPMHVDTADLNASTTAKPSRRTMLRTTDASHVAQAANAVVRDSHTYQRSSTVIDTDQQDDRSSGNEQDDVGVKDVTRVTPDISSQHDPGGTPTSPEPPMHILQTDPTSSTTEKQFPTRNGSDRDAQADEAGHHSSSDTPVETSSGSEHSDHEETRNRRKSKHKQRERREWTEKEDIAFIAALEKHGRDFGAMLPMLPGRTRAQIRTHYRYIARSIRQNRISALRGAGVVRRLRTRGRPKNGRKQQGLPFSPVFEKLTKIIEKLEAAAELETHKQQPISLETGRYIGNYKYGLAPMLPSTSTVGFGAGAHSMHRYGAYHYPGTAVFATPAPVRPANFAPIPAWPGPTPSSTSPAPQSVSTPTSSTSDSSTGKKRKSTPPSTTAVKTTPIPKPAPRAILPATPTTTTPIYPELRPAPTHRFQPTRAAIDEPVVLAQIHDESLSYDVYQPISDDAYDKAPTVDDSMTVSAELLRACMEDIMTQRLPLVFPSVALINTSTQPQTNLANARPL